MTRSTLHQLNQQKISDRVKLAAYNALVIFEDGPFTGLRHTSARHRQSRLPKTSNSVLERQGV